MVRMMVTSSKKTYVSMPHLPRLLLLVPFDPVAGHYQPMHLPETPKHSQASLAQALVQSLLLYPGSSRTHGFFVFCFFSPPRVSVSPVLWKLHNQIPLTFKVRFPEDSQSFCWILRLGSLLWGLELLQQ